MMNQKYTNVKILPIPSNFVEIKRILTLKIKHLKYKLRTNWEKNFLGSIYMDEASDVSKYINADSAFLLNIVLNIIVQCCYSSNFHLGYTAIHQ